MKKTLFLLLFGLSLSFAIESGSLVDSISHSQKNPLEACDNCNGWIENKLIELLDHVIAAKRYWLTVGDRPWYRVITRPIHHWFNFSWQTEIKEHLSHLEDLQNTLAIKLAKHVADDAEFAGDGKEDIYELIAQANIVLKTHGIPLHVMRNWVFYAGSAVAIYKIAQLYKEHLKDTVIFKFDSKDRETIDNASRDSNNRHGIMQEGSNIWLTTSVKNKDELEDKLSKYSKIEYTVLPATASDLRRLLLDENGQFLGKTFVYTCFINPVKNIWYKLKNDSTTKQSSYPIEAREANKQIEKDCMVSLLNTLAAQKDDKNNPLYPEIHEAKERYIKFEEVSAETLKGLLNKLPIPLGDYLQTLTFDSLKQFLKTLSNETDKIGFIGSYLSMATKAGEAALKGKKLEETPEYKWFQYFLAGVKLEYPSIKNNVLTFVNALEFLTESAKMTPFFLGLYVGGRGVTGASQWYRDHYFKEPLRYDLKDFINFLDENLYTHLSNPAFKGLHYYWTVRLKRYKSFMDSKNRIYFEKDLQKLTRGSTINHEIETLRVILYNELEHL